MSIPAKAMANNSTNSLFCGYFFSLPSSWATAAITSAPTDEIGLMPVIVPPTTTAAVSSSALIPKVPAS